jgi:hypothetical protein
MITPKEYFSVIKKVDVASLPEKLRKAHDFTEEVTEYHTTWKYYKSDRDIKKVVDNYLKELSEYLKKKPVPKENLEKAARNAAGNLIRAYVERGYTVEQIRQSRLGRMGGEFSAEVRANKIYVTELNGKKVNYSFPLQSTYNEIKDEMGSKKTVEPERKKQSAPRPKTQKREKRETKKPEPSYALMHGKEKTDRQVLSFLNAVQKAILEKRIRKNSPYAAEIVYIQENLAKLYNRMSNIAEISVNKDAAKVPVNSRFGKGSSFGYLPQALHWHTGQEAHERQGAQAHGNYTKRRPEA